MVLEFAEPTGGQYNPLFASVAAVQKCSLRQFEKIFEYMKDETRDFLDKLQSADWFSKIELPVMHKSKFIEDITLNTFVDAFVLFNNQSYEELRDAFRDPIFNEMNNDLHSRLTMNWDNFIVTSRPIVNSLIEPKLTSANICPDALLKSTWDGFRWQIIHALCCIEFNEFPMPTFYIDWCNILINGHFACYWDGDIEEGQFVVI